MNQHICPSCFEEIKTPSYYQGMEVCGCCFKILKTNLQDLNSFEMRKLSSFLSFWAGLKYGQELKVEKQKAKEQSKALAKLS
jgi:hypothetical protein